MSSTGGGIKGYGQNSGGQNGASWSMTATQAQNALTWFANNTSPPAGSDAATMLANQQSALNFANT